MHQATVFALLGHPYWWARQERSDLLLRAVSEAFHAIGRKVEDYALCRRLEALRAAYCERGVPEETAVRVILYDGYVSASHGEPGMTSPEILDDFDLFQALRALTETGPNYMFLSRRICTKAGLGLGMFVPLRPQTGSGCPGWRGDPLCVLSQIANRVSATEGGVEE